MHGMACLNVCNQPEIAVYCMMHATCRLASYYMTRTTIHDKRAHPLITAALNMIKGFPGKTGGGLGGQDFLLILLYRVQDMVYKCW